MGSGSTRSEISAYLFLYIVPISLQLVSASSATSGPQAYSALSTEGLYNFVEKCLLVVGEKVHTETVWDSCIWTRTVQVPAFLQNHISFPDMVVVEHRRNDPNLSLGRKRWLWLRIQYIYCSSSYNIQIFRVVSAALPQQAGRFQWSEGWTRYIEGWKEGSRWWVPCRCCPEKSNLYLTCSMCVSQSKITQKRWHLYIHNKRSIPSGIGNFLRMSEKLCTIPCSQAVCPPLFVPGLFADILFMTVPRCFMVWWFIWSEEDPAQFPMPAVISNRFPHYELDEDDYDSISPLLVDCSSQSDRTWKFPRGSLEHNRSHRPFVDDVLLGCLSGAP